jgi:hypothetical protein
MSDEPTLLFDVLDAIEDALKHCAPDKRKALADKLDAYSEDCPEDFFWAVGHQSPTMLNMLMVAIDTACRADGGAKRNVVVRLIDRKPEGSA